jgi:hypothetical protein
MRDGNGILFFSFFRKRKDTMDSPTPLPANVLAE